MTGSSRPRTDCARCQRAVWVGLRWPDGFVCLACVRRGARRRGHCPRCGTERALPGIGDDGQPICRDCAGIRTSFVCATCGEEGELWFARTCLRCSLHRRASELLADDTGQPAKGLQPLLDAITSMTEPRSGLLWLRRPAVRQRLRAMAGGSVPISHEGLDQLPAGQGREFLRELLMARGVLPARNKYLLAFDRWVAARLADIDAGDRQLIRAYVRWRHQRELAARANGGQLSTSATARARERTNAAIRLCNWLRGRGVTFARCTQADIDAWYATASNPAAANDFITWAVRHRHCPTLTMPTRPHRHPERGAESDRQRLLARLATDDTIALETRVAGCLVLLLGQPVTRVAALSIDQIESRDDEVWLRLGAHPLPLPAPVGTLLRNLAAGRRNMSTAANPTSSWLFPGGAPGQHLRPRHLAARLFALGVNTRLRQAALHQLVLEVPVPVLAESLGYHPETLASLAAEVGTDWAGYAAEKVRWEMSNLR